MSSTRISLLMAFFVANLIPSSLQAEILIDFQPAQSVGSSAQSLCQCFLTDDSAMLHWNCAPFTHSVSTETRSDASLSAVVTGGAGSVSVTPISASDQTHYSSGDESAEVVMTMGGTGTVNVMINVAINANSSVAGNHNTTVFLTVTSN